MVKPPLTPIPVTGAFDRVGVDVLQLPRTRRGNRYAVVFVDYLTKWPEVFPVADQSSATIAKLLVEQVVSRHGVPSEILSDRGRAFLSGLMKEVETLLGYHKVNTTVYHDPRLPVPAALSPKTTPVIVDLQEYGIELHMKMPRAWELARKCIRNAQKRQKTCYDRKLMNVPFRPGERVFLFKPVEKTGEARKLACRPFHGPYRIAS